MTWRQLKGVTPSHQPRALAVSCSSSLLRSIWVVTLHTLLVTSSHVTSLTAHLRQLEMFLTPLVTLSATQKVSAVSRTQASALSAIRKEL